MMVVVNLFYFTLPLFRGICFQKNYLCKYQSFLSLLVHNLLTSSILVIRDILKIMIFCF